MATPKHGQHKVNGGLTSAEGGPAAQFAGQRWPVLLTQTKNTIKNTLRCCRAVAVMLWW